MSEPVTDYSVDPETYPSDLLARDRWFLWKYDQGRKIPRAPWETGGDQYVSAMDDQYWTDFETATEWREKLTDYHMASVIPNVADNSTERVILLDFDNCRDPETGAIHPTAWGLLMGTDERGNPFHGALSTSGTGIHAYVWASIPEGYKPSFTTDLPEWDTVDGYDGNPFDDGKPPELEVYASDRFIGLTGDHIADTPVKLPEASETIHGMFHKFGSERSTGTEREPTKDRQTTQNIDKTADIETIYDAIANTKPSDIRLDSTVTEERADGTLSLDPSWEQSDSGTRLAQLDDHWHYRKGNIDIGALQVVALEERIITDPSDYPSGSDFWDAVEELRDRGASIPEYAPPNEGAGQQPRPSESGGTTGGSGATGGASDATGGEAGAADGGGGDAPETDRGAAEAQAVAGSEEGDVEDGASDGATDATDGGGGGGDGGEEGDGEGDSGDDWDSIYSAYAAASGDEKKMPRYRSVSLLSDRHHWRNIRENDSLYKYDAGRGIYQDNAETDVRAILTDALREQFTAHELNEVCMLLRGRHTVPQDEMGGPEGKIAAENCVLDLINDQVLDHDPEFEFLSRLGTEYDPDADCPQWKAFLDDAVPSKTEVSKLQEFTGYMLHHWGLPHHKALFLVGPTASGKSTFLDTVNAMLGDGTTSSLTPQQMVSERFGGADLHGKWANIRNDIPASTVENTGQFKEIIAGDPLKAEEKFKDPFTFRPTAKHAFSANQLPDADTDDEAFFRRILLVPFPETVPRGQRDPKLGEKLRDELPGILNWAIEGLKRLLGNGGFTGDRRPGATQDTWEKWGNSVKRFEKVAVENGSDRIPKAMAYAAYLQYCRQESIPTETRHSFTRKLGRVGGYTQSREYIDGDRKRVFEGIQWTGRGEQLLSAAENGGSSTSTDKHNDSSDGDTPRSLDDY